jgi:hypothetical protein
MSLCSKTLLFHGRWYDCGREAVAVVGPFDHPVCDVHAVLMRSIARRVRPAGLCVHVRHKGPDLCTRRAAVETEFYGLSMCRQHAAMFDAVQRQHQENADEPLPPEPVWPVQHKIKASVRYGHERVPYKD